MRDCLFSGGLILGGAYLISEFYDSFCEVSAVIFTRFVWFVTTCLISICRATELISFCKRKNDDNLTDHGIMYGGGPMDAKLTRTLAMNNQIPQRFIRNLAVPQRVKLIKS